MQKGKIVLILFQEAHLSLEELLDLGWVTLISLYKKIKKRMQTETPSLTKNYLQ